MDIEINKLKAINCVNLEIWNRIKLFQNDLRKIKFKSYYSRYRLEMKIKLNFPPIESLSVWFPKEMNYFNDNIPDTHYFDLSESIQI
jgi:hypothetical protein